MRIYKAVTKEYKVLLNNGENLIYPYLREKNGDKEICCISPYHGRSFLVGRNNGRYIISKGNGLSYTQYSFVNTQEIGNDSWGLLLEQDAVRDFHLNLEISALGIKTNRMEYVLELESEVSVTEELTLHPILLQYSVECPYRICDAAYMSQKQINNEISKWDTLNQKEYAEHYMIAADCLIRNLRILHNNGILHNAIHTQNYTWALELLDFELACSPLHPYNSEDDMRHIKNLFPREIMQTYEVINSIAWCLKEEIDFGKVDKLFKEYGFDIEGYKLRFR